MTKTRLLPMLLLGLALITHTDHYASKCLAAGANQRAESSYKGRYSGPYTVEAAAVAEQSGKFTLSIDVDGDVKGKAENHTTGRSADVSGSVNEDGDIRLILEWPESTYTIKGTVVRTKNGHLKGTLNQYSGKEVIATIKMDLSPQ
jgi:hypothetical protein